MKLGLTGRLYQPQSQLLAYRGSLQNGRCRLDVSHDVVRYRGWWPGTWTAVVLAQARRSLTSWFVLVQALVALAVLVLTGCMPPYYRAGCNGFKLSLDAAALWILLCGASLSSVRTQCSRLVLLLRR